MECRIKHTHLRQAWQQRTYSIYTLDVGWVVEWCKVITTCKHLHYLIVQPHALVKLLTTMYHTVTYSFDFVEGFQYSGLAFSQALEDELHTCGMLSNRMIYLYLLTIEFYFDERVGQANLFDSSRCDDRLVGHVI